MDFKKLFAELGLNKHSQDIEEAQTQEWEELLAEVEKKRTNVKPTDNKYEITGLDSK